jgi:hypothetical protein
VITGASGSITHGSQAIETATCPLGKTVIGGGGSNNGDNFVTLCASYPESATVS